MREKKIFFFSRSVFPSGLEAGTYIPEGYMCKILQLYTFITVNITNYHRLNPTLQNEGKKPAL